MGISLRLAGKSSSPSSSSDYLSTRPASNHVPSQAMEWTWMSGAMLSQRAGSRTRADRYLGPREYVIYTCRRHLVVLDAALGIWLGTLVFALAGGLAARRHPGSHMAWVGAALFLTGSVFLGCQAWQWSSARYVFTNDRVLFIRGILSRKVNGLPLRMVLDTTYRRSFAGRLRGYGDLELNLSGQPGLRTLTSLPQPDAIYQLVLSLSGGCGSCLASAPTLAYPSE